MKDKIIKTLKSPADWQRYKLSELVAFECAKCGKLKKSKLITLRANDWDTLYCNACYGFKLKED